MRLTHARVVDHSFLPFQDFHSCSFFPVTVILKMAAGVEFSNPLKKFKLVFLGEQSGKSTSFRFFLPFNFSRYTWKTYNCVLLLHLPLKPMHWFSGPDCAPIFPHALTRSDAVKMVLISLSQTVKFNQTPTLVKSNLEIRDPG